MVIKRGRGRVLGINRYTPLCCAYSLSCFQYFVVLWTTASQGPLFMGILQARILELVAMPSSSDLPNTRIEPRFPTLQADSLPSKPPGKPKNIGVSSLSLLQENFPTQELIWGLLHCRRILNQLSYQGSPQKHTTLYKIDKNKILLYSTRTYIQYVLHCLPEFAQIHIHWFRDVSNSWILCQPLLLLPWIFPRVRVFSNGSSHKVAKVLELQLQSQFFQWISKVYFL